eukprot:142392-Alexandrium_andersonii.AAC.1
MSGRGLRPGAPSSIRTSSTARREGGTSPDSAQAAGLATSPSLWPSVLTGPAIAASTQSRP